MFIVLLFLDRLGAAVGPVNGRASFIGQLILVLLVLQSQLPLPASVAMASLYPLQTVLNLPDQLLQIVGLELLVVLFDAVLDGLVQLDGLGFRDRQVAHELGALLPVSLVVIVALFFQNLWIKI